MVAAAVLKHSPVKSAVGLHEDSRLLRELEAILATRQVKALNHPRLPYLAAELEGRLVDSLVARRMARGMKRLYNLLGESAHVRSLTRLLLLLEVADDMRVRLIHPQSGWQGEFHLEGIECNRHLLAEVSPHLPMPSDHRGILPFVFYSNADICLVPDADRRLKSPFRIWDCTGPRDFPKVDGVYTAYLGDQAHRLDARRDRLFPGMMAKITSV